MIKEINAIRGTRIVEEETGKTLALLNLPIVNPDTGLIEAFWVKPVTLAIKDAILQTNQILEFKKKIYIKSDKKLSEPSQVIRIAELLEDGRRFLDTPVENEKGVSYGRVGNFSFSTETYLIKNLHVKKLFLGLISYQLRIFPYERILKVTQDKIIVDDDASRIVEAPAETA